MEEVFSFETIQAKYQDLDYKKGWTFMMSPEHTLRTAKVAFVGLNPGGGGEGDNHPYVGNWDVPGGNAYLIENWGKDGKTQTPIQLQLKAWHELLGVPELESLCIQFVPFRSPSWSKLDRKEEALAFSRNLWRWVLKVSPATIFVTMGKVPAYYLADLLGAKYVAPLPTGWGKQTIDVWECKGGRRIIGMPHPSRYRLFNRADGLSATAEANFRAAAMIS